MLNGSGLAVLVCEHLSAFQDINIVKLTWWITPNIYERKEADNGNHHRDSQHRVERIVENPGEWDNGIPLSTKQNKTVDKK